MEGADFLFREPGAVEWLSAVTQNHFSILKRSPWPRCGNGRGVLPCGEATLESAAIIQVRELVASKRMAVKTCSKWVRL